MPLNLNLVSKADYTMSGEAKQVKPNRTLDCIGLYCPIPVFKTREEMDTLNVGQVLEVVADDPAAEEDLKYWAKSTGQQIIELRKEGEKVRFLIRKVR